MSDKAKSTNYKREFNAQNYDRIELTVKKGKKEKLKTHAAQRGETVNGFINRAINETVERDEREQDTDTRQAETAPVLPVEAVKKARGARGSGTRQS